MSSSKGRPFHTLSREIRENPDQSEPSFSFEDKFFLGDAGDDAEDEFHRRLACNNRRDTGGGGDIGGSSLPPAPGSGSFWRTEIPSIAQIQPVSVRERKSSGGLLGAALQLHSQSSSGDLQEGSGDSIARARPVSSSIEKSDRRSGVGSSSLTSPVGTIGAPNGSLSGIRDTKKSITKQRAEARRLKLDSLLEDVDIGHVVEESNDESLGSSPRSSKPSEGRHDELNNTTKSIESFHSLDSNSDTVRNSSSSSTNGLFPSAGKSSSGSSLFGKGSSLLFPTGVESSKRRSNPSSRESDSSLLRQKISLLLDQCESVRWPLKKKLILANLGLEARHIPVKELRSTNLGNTLYKLSLSGNQLKSLPPQLVSCLPTLKTLDLSQCSLHLLPEKWKLPQLKRLNLSHNRLTDFPEEAMLEGLPELVELNMYGNKVSVIIVPHNPKLLAKLETLNLGYNDLAYLPEELDRLKSLRTLKVMNNFLDKIPMRICDMELKYIDVSSNPVIQPPIETCDRGVQSMKRYYHNLRMEEQSKHKATEALESKQGGRSSKKSSKTKSLFNLNKPNIIKQINLGRKADAESSGANGDASSLSNVSRLGLDSEVASVKKCSLRRAATLDTAEPKRLTGSASFSLDDESRRSVSLDMMLKPIKPVSEEFVALSKESSSSLPAAFSTPEMSTAVDPGGIEHDLPKPVDEVTVNDTLKVIFVGMAMAGKTSMIKRLIEGESAVVPKRDERTVGVDIYEWDPKVDRRFEHIDSRIELQDKSLEMLCGDVNIKFSVWDFAGQHVYHATHELFFSPRALYILVWDMGANNPATKARKSDVETQQGAFSLTYDSDGDTDDDGDFTLEEEISRADRALKRDIDDKIQFWVDCIQSSAPGAAILPVASFDDVFNENPQEAKRRCNILKQRLLDHEARRIKGIKDRYYQFVEENRANDEAALRLRRLLGPYQRPKLIFGETEEDAVVRVSGTKYTGFADLTGRIINIAIGREKVHLQYPIFRGHVGARIPRMRLQVREVVRSMRDRFKVVEWGYFTRQLETIGITEVEDISDALHFLTSIGELAYFGGVDPGKNKMVGNVDAEWTKDPRKAFMSLMGSGDDVSALSEDDAIDIDDETAEGISRLSVANAGFMAPLSESESQASIGETLFGGLSQFIFLNPRWLVAAVACILRHDLDREIQETRRALAHGHGRIKRGDSFYEANLNCPVITAEDACMLWQAKKFTKKAAERVEEYSNDMPLKPFEFLQLLLIRFGVFIPIDLGIEKAFLGGTEYARRLSNHDKSPEELSIGHQNSILKATFFFLPSLLGPGEPAEAWTYKSTDSWKATLCHSVLFPDGVPPGLMERITASVLSNIYAISHRQAQHQQYYTNIDGTTITIHEGKISIKEVLCWRTAFLVKVGMQGWDDTKESIVEVFCGLVDKESHLCVGSDSMLSGMRRLVTSGKGQEGDGGRKIWKGGYLIVLKAVQKVMDQYGGLEYEKQGFCPDCLAKKAVAEASHWDFTVIRKAVKNGESIMRCRYGHRIDTRLLAGPLENFPPKASPGFANLSQEPIVPIHDLLRGVVVVGLWDSHSKSSKVVRVGSGFIADRKRGLVVTAAHTLMNIWGDRNTPFGENYYGLRNGKVVIGIIPKTKGEDTGTEAVFRYFAKIVSKDPFIEQGVCQLDACVLKITTRMENDVSGNGEGCGDQPERLLLNNPMALKQEKLHQLKITDKCELDEQVRIVGYNQGGEGLLGPGSSLNRYVDFARGYVCKKFAAGEGAVDDQQCHRFKPREEIVVICPTIGGHSGGPCVNQQGEVIGILSRADPAENQRCYLVPTYEWRALLKEAKNAT